ncbi:MAG: tripartite tricarboxylate transporter substrate binding protein [Variovorax sp.]
MPSLPFVRCLAFVAMAGAAIAMPALALAQEPGYPRKPITLVVPFAAGGGTDTVARLIALKLYAALGQSVVVDNRPGANGTIASRSVLQQPADGYTLMFGSNSTHVIAPLAAKQAPDAMKATQANFAIVSIVANAPLVLAVRSSASERDLPAFLARAKSSSLSYGTFGAGSSAHVMGEVLSEAAKVELLHVPYKGSAPAMNDLLGGQVDSVLLTVAAMEGMVSAGTVRPLAVTGRMRVQSLPNVPTFEELGVRDMNNAGWFAVFAAAKTPDAVVTKVAGALREIVSQPEVKAKLVELGLEPVGSTSQDARETWRKSVALAEPVVKRAKIEF